MAILRGRVQSVLYTSSGFNVLALVVHSTDPPVGQKVAKACGPLHGLTQIKVGVTLELHGSWTTHRIYGDQFFITTWQPWYWLPADVSLFLSSCIQGMHDPDLVRAVIDHWGAEAAFAQLSATDPLDNSSLVVAREHWRAAIDLRDLANLLQDDGLSASAILSIMQAFGHEAKAVINSDPYRLMEVAGVPFSVADRIANRLGIPHTDTRRIAGASLCALRDAVRSGHLYLPRGEIVSWARHFVPTLTTVDEVMDMLVARRAVVVEPGVGAYLPEWYNYEQMVAQWLAYEPRTKYLDVDADSFIKTYEQSAHITLSDDQRQAIRTLADNRVVILTGLPGTGKTTVVRAFVRMFEAAKVDFMLVASTGIAAKRLSTVTERSASTIHRALKYDGSRWFHDETNRLVVSAVIVDEMSMVDQELIYRLLSALRRDTIVAFVGDDAQLSSVGPGLVLRELINCPVLPSVRLRTIFRQSAKGDIVLNAHKINRGETLSLDRNPDSEFQFVPMSDQGAIVDLVVEMATKLKARDANFQVLSPMYEGTVGVNNLNERLRDRLNPSKGQPEYRRDDLHFRVGDRLMVVQNDHQLAVYNGDVGKLIAITGEHLVVRIHGASNDPDTEVRFPIEQASKLRLAYASTVHKCQGSEFDTIIMPLVNAHGRMLQRNLFYTAVTRARRKVWILGELSAVQRAIQNDAVQKCNTRLSERILKQAKLV